MNDMLVIVPSRGRPKNQERFLEYFFKNSTISDICFVLDTDDESNYPRFNKVIYEILKAANTSDYKEYELNE